MSDKPPPTISQREMLNVLNKRLGTNYAIPATEKEAKFLIDEMRDAERKEKLMQTEQFTDSVSPTMSIEVISINPGVLIEVSSIL